MLLAEVGSRKLKGVFGELAMKKPVKEGLPEGVY